ncbi:MAG: DUF4918 family protein [Bacteroidetes bacterium]|nr:DUF4918 family protein [Bacteroidota bacterium]
MNSWADRILAFQKKLSLDIKLPRGVGVLNPYKSETAFELCQQFYRQFYSDSSPRKIILGINPGRFGGGVTGIPFTDPANLAALGIANTLPKKHELSSEFIYRMIDEFDGPKKFYSQFYFSSLSPLGFVKDDKNLNYYDIPALAKKLTGFMVEKLREQIGWGIDTSVGFCLGEGENYKFLKNLNNHNHFFKTIVPLPHPRFIMQYKRKQLAHYIALYEEKLKSNFE